MQLKRGEILLDPKFVYPNTTIECDKWLLVLNKTHTAPDDVVVVPCKTKISKDPNNYVPGCNQKLKAFYFDKKIGFYNAGTVVQLEFVRVLSYDSLREKIAKGQIDPKARTKEEELNRIINCLKQIKDDIPVYIQELIF